MVANPSPEQEHLMMILDKCRTENDPNRLVDHLQAVKTYYLAFSLQQNTLMHQLKYNQVVDGELEDRLVDECQGCAGETQQVFKELHRFLRRFEDNPDSDPMRFRVESMRLIQRFDRSLKRVSSFSSQLAEHMAG
ncbi:MAG: hypothetical protein G8345_02255 [Magnetococcales bacterium]|nr:hypothetical protein [Magnetococcales bacterium]NGZ25693.1 hypothetical protein [Magnetococcales bacterium]